MKLSELINPIAICDMLPAVAQGAIGIEQREDNRQIQKFLAPIHDQETELRLLVERSFLSELDGSCRTPIGGLAEIVKDQIIFTGEILKPDGSQIFSDTWNGSLSQAASLGRKAGLMLKEKGGEGFFK